MKQRLLNLSDMAGRTVEAVDETDANNVVLITFADGTWIGLAPRRDFDDAVIEARYPAEGDISNEARVRLGITTQEALDAIQAEKHRVWKDDVERREREQLRELVKKYPDEVQRHDTP